MRWNERVFGLTQNDWTGPPGAIKLVEKGQNCQKKGRIRQNSLKRPKKVSGFKKNGFESSKTILDQINPSFQRVSTRNGVYQT